MKIAAQISGIVLIFLSISCSSGKNTTTKEEVKVSNGNDALESIASDCPEILIDKELFANSDVQGIEVLDISIKGSKLNIECRFSGCPSDELILLGNGAIKKSYPAQSSLKLSKSEPGYCEAIQTRKVCFLLTELAPSKPVFISVNGSQGVLFGSKD